MSVPVEETAAGVARVNGAVCLQKLHGLAVDGKLTVCCADDSCCDCSAQFSQRIADGNGHVSDLKLIAVAVYRRSQSGGFDLKHGHIVRLIGPDKCRLIGVFIARRHGDLVRTVDDVIVRHDVAVLADDDAASRAFGNILLHPAVAHHAFRPNLYDALLCSLRDFLDRHIAACCALQIVTRRLYITRTVCYLSRFCRRGVRGRAAVHMTSDVSPADSEHAGDRHAGSEKQSQRFSAHCHRL